MTSPMASENPYGSEFAAVYDQLYPKDASAEQIAELLHCLAERPGTALELGVGTGRVAIPLLRRGHRLVGVDSSAAMLEVLSRELVAADAQMETVEADIRNYADERRYDLVYCVCATLAMVLDLEQQQETVRLAAERVAPGGHLVIETLNAAGIERLTEGRLQSVFFRPYAEPNTGVLSAWNRGPSSDVWHVSHVWFADGTFRVLTESSRPSLVKEIDEMVAKTGLRPTARYSDWTKTPFVEDCRKFVLVYQKEAS